MRRIDTAYHLLPSLPVLLFGWLLLPAPVEAQNAEAEVIAVVERLFDGMRTQDTTMMRSVFAPQAHMYGVGRDGTVSARSPDGFIASVGSRQGGMLDERVFSPQVRIDGNLATVWTYYTLHIGEEFSHCGYDAFMLYRLAEGWKIVSLADTRRPENCEAPGG